MSDVFFLDGGVDEYFLLLDFRIEEVDGQLTDVPHLSCQSDCENGSDLKRQLEVSTENVSLQINTASRGFQPNAE